MLNASNVLVFTGHLVDAAERDTKRFPHGLISEAADIIAKSIDEVNKIHPVGIAISSLGAGGDMLFAAEVLKRGIPLHVFIPLDKETFIEQSVEYLKSGADADARQWKAEFERILTQAQKVIFTTPPSTGQLNPFAACNTAMLQQAFELAGSERRITGLALVKPGEEPIEGGAAHFVLEMRQRQIPVQILWPNIGEAHLEDIQQLDLLIPVFKHLDEEASFYQSKWRRRLKLSLVVLASIAFFDAFVTVPDHFLMGYGQIVRIICLLTSAAGAFITLQLQLSDKTSLSQWTRSRAKAEQIRSEIWFYLFNYWSENNRFGPYSEGELESYIAGMKPKQWQDQTLNLSRLIALKEEVQSMTLSQRIDYYLHYRLEDQLQYFTRKGRHFSDRLNRYKRFTLLFLGVSITWGTLKMFAEFYPSLSFFMDMSPLGMMISFIALVSSYSEANNSKEMEYKYQQMAEGLTVLRNKKSRIKELVEVDEWVKECEVFLRTQNNEWSLKREK